MKMIDRSFFVLMENSSPITCEMDSKVISLFIITVFSTDIIQPSLIIIGIAVFVRNGPRFSHFVKTAALRAVTEALKPVSSRLSPVVLNGHIRHTRPSAFQAFAFPA